MTATMTKNETFGAMLRRLRAEAGMKQEDVGARVGATGATVSNWEKDKHPPGYATVKTLVEVFGEPALLERAGFPAEGYVNVYELLRAQQEELAELRRIVDDLQQQQRPD